MYLFSRRCIFWSCSVVLSFLLVFGSLLSRAGFGWNVFVLAVRAQVPLDATFFAKPSRNHLHGEPHLHNSTRIHILDDGAITSSQSSSSNLNATLGGALLSNIVEMLSKQAEDNPAKVNSGDSWRRLLLNVLPALLALKLPLHAMPGDVYEFGVFEGASMKVLRDVYPDVRLIGFDSFQGLPDEANGVIHFKEWTRGKYNSGDIRHTLTEALGGPEKVLFVKGFYSETLTPALHQHLGLRPARYIDIDVDLYISSLQALDFMFGRGLVHVGTLIGYDDWWPPRACRQKSKDRNPLTSGRSPEARAHKEIAAKYGVSFQCVAGACKVSKGRAPLLREFGTIFLVVAIGNTKQYDHGFHVTDGEISQVCRR